MTDTSGVESGATLAAEILADAASAQDIANSVTDNPTVQQAAQDLANALTGIATQVSAFL